MLWVHLISSADHQIFHNNDSADENYLTDSTLMFYLSYDARSHICFPNEAVNILGSDAERISILGLKLKRL